MKIDTSPTSCKISPGEAIPLTFYHSALNHLQVNGAGFQRPVMFDTPEEAADGLSIAA